MISLSLSEIASCVDGQLVGSEKIIESITTDTRAINAGELFIALRGDNFDGHNFLAKAIEKGCAGVLVDHQCDLDIAQIIVKDTKVALGQIGAYIKAQVAPKTVAITGSSGKTTVKEMVAAILSQLGSILATKGNFNNDIGVPLTLLRLERHHQYAVIELGANHQGEIAYTSGLVKPDVALINNIAAAHLEGFGSLQGVAQAKGEIFSGLIAQGTAIFNRQSLFADEWQWRLSDKKVCTVSVDEVADCYSSNIKLDESGCAAFLLTTPVGQQTIQLTLPGEHNVANALAAAAVAINLGASLQEVATGLLSMSPVKGRLNLYPLTQNFTVIDDSYNANVDSVKAAIDLLANYSGQRLLVLGDMAELGTEGESYHQEIGQYAKAAGINQLFTFGELSTHTAKGFYQDEESFIENHFTNKSELSAQVLAQQATTVEQFTVLVKGSRSAHMEEVVNTLLEWRKGQTQEDKG